MHVESTSKTVASICDELKRGAMTINRDYQRQPGVWPGQAQSFLIETILLRYPIPKVTLYEHTDVNTRTTTSEVVDGQQRITAVKLFWDDKLRISKSSEIEDAQGCTYSQLPSGLQQIFVSYSMGIDLLVDTTPAAVRDIFRRINSYEVPLNSEEQRHATHQGPFKWFIYHLAKDYSEEFRAIGTFTDRNLIRMADMKLLAEVCHALDFGIATTKKDELDSLYKRYDDDFPHEKDWDEWIRSALSYVLSLQGLGGTRLLSRQYSLYSLLLAVIWLQYGVTSLAGSSGGQQPGQLADSMEASARLAKLEEELDKDVDTDDGYRPFRKAFDRGTNVKKARESRFEFFVRSLRTT